jgi:hypothetical protein
VDLRSGATLAEGDHRATHCRCEVCAVTPCSAVNGRVQLDLIGSRTFENPRLLGHLRLIDAQAGGVYIGSGLVALALDGRHMTLSTQGLQAFSLDGVMTIDDTLSARVRLGGCAPDRGLASVQLGGAAKGAVKGDVSGAIEMDGQLWGLSTLNGGFAQDRLGLRSNAAWLQNGAPLRWPLAGGVLQSEAVRLMKRR